MLLSLFACQNEEAPSQEAEPSSDNSAEASKEEKPMGGVQIANPFYTFDNLDEAVEVTGFSMTLPEVPSWAKEVVYRPKTDATMLEVIYFNDTDEIRMRKAPGSDKDISGMYNEFENSEEITVGEKTVTVKGKEGKAYMAVWTDGDFSYFVRDTMGLTNEEMAKLIEVIA